MLLACSNTTLPDSSSLNGACHPPWGEPPSRSSSGPPGACATPSSVTNSVTMSWPMVGFPFLAMMRAYPVQTRTPFRIHRGACRSRASRKRAAGIQRNDAPCEAPLTPQRRCRRSAGRFGRQAVTTAITKVPLGERHSERSWPNHRLALEAPHSRFSCVNAAEGAVKLATGVSYERKLTSMRPTRSSPSST